MTSHPSFAELFEQASELFDYLNSTMGWTGEADLALVANDTERIISAEPVRVQVAITVSADRMEVALNPTDTDERRTFEFTIDALPGDTDPVLAQPVLLDPESGVLVHRIAPQGVTPMVRAGDVLSVTVGR